VSAPFIGSAGFAGTGRPGRSPLVVEYATKRKLSIQICQCPDRKFSIQSGFVVGLDHGPIVASPVTLEQADALAALLHALGDRTRVLIVSALLHSPTGELHGRDLQEQLSLRQPTASHHLHKLVRAGVLSREQRGPYAYFRVVPDAFECLRAIFDDGPIAGS
jgi:ArsR family transcriptional regulator, arsenate/arsenite/antimonite-responsive transcriptional repressor